MIENTQFNFTLSISNEGYKEKPKDYNTIFFNKQNIILDDLIKYIKEGFCYMAELKRYDIINYTDKQGNNKQYQPHREEHIKQTNIISIDVDDSDLSFYDYINNISIKPSYAYTTFNNNIKGRRYRLLYLVNTPISKQTDFESYYNGLIDQLNKDTSTQNNDDCGRKIERLFNGNSKEDIEEYKTYFIYDLTDIPTIKTTPIIKQIKPRIKKEDDDFITDYKTLSFDDFIMKYKPSFEVVQNTFIKYNNEGYALLNDDYIEIKRFFKDGKLKIRDIGEDRKKYLFSILQIKKIIKPSISFEEMLYNAIFEVYYYINNTDGKLKKDYILEVVKNVMNNESKIKVFQNTKKYKVSKQYCIDNNTTPNQYKNVIRKKINYIKIKEWYNKELTPNENYKLAISKGIKIARQTIYNFAKENGYMGQINSITANINEWYNKTLSIKENYQIAKDNDIKVSLRSLYDYCNNNNINKKGEKTNDSISSNIIDNDNFDDGTENRGFLISISSHQFNYNNNIPTRLKQYIEDNNFECCKECLLKVFYKVA